MNLIFEAKVHLSIFVLDFPVIIVLFDHILLFFSGLLNTTFGTQSCPWSESHFPKSGIRWEILSLLVHIVLFFGLFTFFISGMPR